MEPARNLPQTGTDFTATAPEPNMSRGDFQSRIRELSAKQAAQTSETPADARLVDADTGAELAQPDRQAETAVPPKTLKDFAEQAGLEAKDLYSLEITLEAANGEAKGKTLTLGQLKDLAAKAGDFETRKAAFEETRIEQENELLRARHELQQIVAGLPRNAVKPELLEKIRQETERQREVESERALEVIPQWKDDTVRLKDRDGILKHMAEYGYGPGDFDGIMDHRMLKYVRDNWTRWELVKQAMGNVKAKKPDTIPASRPSAGKGRSSVQYSAPAQTAAQLRDRFRTLG